MKISMQVSLDISMRTFPINSFSYIYSYHILPVNSHGYYKFHACEATNQDFDIKNFNFVRTTW